MQIGLEMKKHALITGGLGFIGSYIGRHLIENDIVERVICLDHFGRYSDSARPEFFDYRRFRLEGISDRVIIERGETRFLSVLYEILGKYQPEYVFHLAALPLAKLENINSQEAREGSVDATAYLLEAMNSISQKEGYKPERFVYTSSSMIYGDFQTNEASENHPKNPTEIYGTMKLAGEVVTLGLGNHYEIPYCIVRPSAVYGPTDMNRRVSQIFLERAFLSQKLTVQGHDEALDFTYIKDIAHGFVLAATREEAVGQIFNITFGKAHTLLEYVECLSKHFPDLEYEITERDEFRPKRGTLSIEKAQRLLNFEPKYDLERGIDEYVAFVRKHNPNFRNNKKS